MKENPATTQPAVSPANRLLARLPVTQRQQVLALCESCELVAGQVLMGPEVRTTHVWFPLDAIVALGIPATGRTHAFGVALVGAEGLVGIPLLLGSAASSLQAVVVRGGGALRIALAPLRLLRGNANFQHRVRQYVLVAFAQLAQAALCTRYHRVEERLARWLLMTLDRAPDAPVQATHEFLAATLGVRRAGVTRAAAVLQARQLISYHRGVLLVLDRAGLQDASCDCYAADCASYASGMRRSPASA